MCQFAVLLAFCYNTIVQLTFIESDDKVVNKATASDNLLLKWPLKTRKLFAHGGGGGAYLTTCVVYKNHIQSSFHFQSKDKHLSHNNSVHSGFFLLKWIKVTTHALYHGKRIESCDGSLTLQNEHRCAHSFRLLFLPYNNCCCCYC